MRMSGYEPIVKGPGDWTGGIRHGKQVGQRRATGYKHRSAVAVAMGRARATKVKLNAASAAYGARSTEPNFRRALRLQDQLQAHVRDARAANVQVRAHMRKGKLVKSYRRK